jgi:hypothetical protein
MIHSHSFSEESPFHQRAVARNAQLQLASILSVLVCSADLLLCQLAAFSALYDTALPSLNSSDILHVKALLTDMPFWTSFRTVLFWASAVFRILYMFEIVARWIAFYMFGTYGTLLELVHTDFIEVLDPLAAIGIYSLMQALLIIRFSLPLALSIIWNNLVFVRIIMRSFKYSISEYQAIFCQARTKVKDTVGKLEGVIGALKKEKMHAETQRDELAHSYGNDGNTNLRLEKEILQHQCDELRHILRLVTGEDIIDFDSAAIKRLSLRSGDLSLNRKVVIPSHRESRDVIVSRDSLSTHSEVISPEM